MNDLIGRLRTGHLYNSTKRNKNLTDSFIAVSEESTNKVGAKEHPCKEVGGSL